MRNSIYFILISFLLLHSCDIDREPYDSRTPEDVLGDEEGLQNATFGNYAILRAEENESEGWGWIDQLHRIGEYGGDNVSLSGVTTDEMFYFYDYNNLVNNGRSNSFWQKSYKAIGGINTIIDEVSKGDIEVEDEDELDQLLGENYYLRALTYFALVNVYGRPYTQDPSALGVPLKLTPGAEDIPDRNTVQEVYDQIIEDLEKAEELLNQDKGPAFASKHAAKALLSRVYLYMDRNEEAVTYAEEVINSGEYALLPTSDLENYSKKKPEDNSETIFALKRQESDYVDGYNTVGGYYSTIDGVGWGEMYASSSYLDLINQHPDDARLGFISPEYLHEDNQRIPAIYWVDDNYNYVFKHTHEKGGKTYFDDEGTDREVKKEQEGGVTKYYFNNSNNKKIYVTKDYDVDKRNGYPQFYIVKASMQEEITQLWSPVISRLAEMYLNRAEAYAKLGETELALNDVNEIRSRADIPTYEGEGDFPKGMDVLDVVLQERRLEMAFEGWRKFDAFRNDQTINRRYPGVQLDGSSIKEEIKPNDDRVILYIPEQQIDIQPSLEQNP